MFHEAHLPSQKIWLFEARSVVSLHGGMIRGDEVAICHAMLLRETVLELTRLLAGMTGFPWTVFEKTRMRIANSPRLFVVRLRRQ